MSLRRKDPCRKGEKSKRILESEAVEKLETAVKLLRFFIKK